MDLALVLDGSDSVGNADFEKLKNWSKSFIENLQVDKYGAKVGVIKYATSIKDVSPMSSDIEDIKVPNVLYFGPEKCLKEFISRVRLASKRQVWSTFFSPKFRVTCQKASLVHFQIVRKGKFAPYSEKNLDQTCLFENISHT